MISSDATDEGDKRVYTHSPKHAFLKELRTWWDDLRFVLLLLWVATAALTAMVAALLHFF